MWKLTPSSGGVCAKLAFSRFLHLSYTINSIVNLKDIWKDYHPKTCLSYQDYNFKWVNCKFRKKRLREILYLKINRCAVWIGWKSQSFDLRPPPSSTLGYTLNQFHNLNKSPSSMMFPSHSTFCCGNSYHIIIWIIPRRICLCQPQIFSPFKSAHYWPLPIFLYFRKKLHRKKNLTVTYKIKKQLNFKYKRLYSTPLLKRNSISDPEK